MFLALICPWCPSELLRPDSRAQGHFYSTNLVSDFMSDTRSIVNQDPQNSTSPGKWVNTFFYKLGWCALAPADERLF